MFRYIVFCLPLSLLCSGELVLSQEPALAPALQVDFVVGDLMDSEAVGDGARWNPESSPLKSPFGIDFDSLENMFIVELGGGRVHKRTPSGQLSHIGGDGTKSFLGDDGPLAKATFNGMHNCAIAPNDDLYIADSWNNRIRKLDAKTGIVTTFAGTGKAGFSGDGGPAKNAQFDFIMCVSLSASGDQLYVADLKNRRIRAIDLQTQVVRTIAGNGKKGVPQDGGDALSNPLVDPRAVAADSDGRVYILERSGQTLRVIDLDGKIHTVAGTGERGHKDGPALQATFGSPKHLCIDDRDNVFIADDQNKAIRIYDPQSKTVSTVLGKKHGDARIQLSRPHGVAWHQGKLYVVDTGHNRILRLKPAGD